MYLLWGDCTEELSLELIRSHDHSFGSLLIQYIPFQYETCFPRKYHNFFERTFKLEHISRRCNLFLGLAFTNTLFRSTKARGMVIYGCYGKYSWTPDIFNFVSVPPHSTPITNFPIFNCIEVLSTLWEWWLKWVLNQNLPIPIPFNRPPTHVMN